MKIKKIIRGIIGFSFSIIIASYVYLFIKYDRIISFEELGLLFLILIAEPIIGTKLKLKYCKQEEEIIKDNVSKEL